MGPDAVGPEAVGPKAVRPEAVGPEAVRPEAVRPEAVRPEAVRPEAASEWKRVSNRNQGSMSRRQMDLDRFGDIFQVGNLTAQLAVMEANKEAVN